MGKKGADFAYCGITQMGADEACQQTDRKVLLDLGIMQQQIDSSLLDLDII